MTGKFGDIKIDTKESTCTWTIPLNTLELIKYLRNDFYKSGYFVCGGCIYNINLQLDYEGEELEPGEIDETAEYIMACGSFNISAFSYDLGFKTSVKKFYDQDNKYINTKCNSYYYINICDFKSLKVVSTFKPRSVDKITYKFMMDDLFTDVKIQLKDEELSMRCHRVILAESSAYFYKMFTSKFAEAKELDRPIIIDGCSAQIFQVIIEYIYTKYLRIPDMLPDELDNFLIALLLGAKLFQVDKLVNRCIYLLNETTTDYNIESRMSAVKNLDLPDLTEKYMNYICDMPREKKSDEFIAKVMEIPLEKLERIRKMCK